MYTEIQLRGVIAGVPAPSLIGVGDNVLDCYLHEDLAYPGGNALNVAAYSRLFFRGDAGFIGIMGDDRFAEHLGGVLDDIGVDRTLVRRVHGANGMAFVTLDEDGDRWFVGSNYGGVQHGLRLRMTEHDQEHVGHYARMHTSVYSAIDAELPDIAARGTRISYDYSDDAAPDVVQRTAEHVDVGFFSGGAMSDSAVDELGRRAVSAGMTTAVVTLGSRGAVAFEHERRSVAAVKEVAAVDALGAGDAFISGFLAARAAGSGTAECLDVAAATGALACLFRGAFGYPVQAGEDARAQILRRYSTT